MGFHSLISSSLLTARDQHAVMSLHTTYMLLVCALTFATARHTRHYTLERAQRGLFDRLPIKPSRTMIPLQLEESPNSDLDPNEDSLDHTSLLKLMGTDYERQFMSVRQPLESLLYPNGSLFYKFRKNQTPADEDMPTEIAALAKDNIKLSEDGLELRIKFSRRTKSKLQKFLWAYSYCPVRYQWTRLSVRFWPRWIKTGTCDNQRSCSIPSGMYCQPSEMRNINLLRYYCPNLKNKASCQWIKIQYPILDRCSCSCDKPDEQKPSYS